MEATVDELDEEWKNFSLEQAVECWKQIGTNECILTHISCHSWKKGRLIAGLSHEERLEYEEMMPGLRFAYDGMTVIL
jgi:ribonuclease BN (tRNA processing enzyme)